MKQTSLLITLLFLTLTRSGNYTIENFTTTRSVPQTENAVIKPVTGKYLVAIQPAQSQPGAFCLRRKYGKDNYGFYEGRLKEGAYEKLSCFKIVGNSFADNVRQKFYPSNNTPFYRDLTDLYFEGNLIFAQNKLEIYHYQNGKMVKLTALPGKPARLLITSSPPGATILVNNRQQGITPLSLGGILDLGVLVRVEKHGYYPREDYVDIKGGIRQTKDFAMSPVYQPGSNGLDLSAMTAKNTESPKELERRLSQLNTEYKRIKKRGESQKRSLSKSYPKLSAQGEFEKTVAYRARLEKYNKDREKALNDLETGSSKRLQSIQSAIKKLKSYKTELESKTYTKKLSINTLTLSRYKPDPEYFPVRVEVKKELFDFTFDGKLNIPISVAKNFKSDVNSASLSVDYVNKSLEVTKGGQKVKRHPFLKSLTIHFKGKKYALEGKFKFPTYISNSPAYKKTRKTLETNVLPGQNKKMVKIPKGCFEMGSEKGESDEKLVHRVCLDAFWIGKHEVTIGEYLACVNAGVCRNPQWLEKGGKFNIHTGSDNLYQKMGMSEVNINYPVTGVSYSDAKTYCEWTGGRLPTEAEWEYAARAGTTTRFYTGNCISSEQANYDGNNPPSGCPKGKYREKALPVGSFPPNPWGLYDISGNVWEWVSDWYDENYYEKSPANKPKGPSRGKSRVLRGGSWINVGINLRSADRNRYNPNYRGDFLGFRRAKSTKP